MNKTRNAFLAFLVGAAAGGVTALLMAPSSGHNTRRKLRRGTNDLYRQSRRRIEDGGEAVRQRAQEVGRTAGERVQAAVRGK